MVIIFPYSYSKPRKEWIFRITFCICLAMAGYFATIPKSSAEETERFTEAVSIYRAKQYPQALYLFEQLHQEAPENLRATYYLAISHAQLGNWAEAKKHYQEILLLDPNSTLAKAAKKGLAALPVDPPETRRAETPSDDLDAPPTKAQLETHPAEAVAAASSNNTSASPMQPSAQATLTPPTLDPQIMQQMLMMQVMGNMSGNAQQAGTTSMNGFNPMTMMTPGMLPQNVPAQINGSGTPYGGNNTPMDPETFSSMMMNQMLQNMDLGGSSKE
jgi:hypothetical protein